MTKSIRDLIPQVLQHVGSKRDALLAVQKAWPGIVGKTLARHATPTSVRKTTLYVHTDEPGASFVLGLERLRLLARLREASGQAIDDIVVRPGAPPT